MLLLIDSFQLICPNLKTSNMSTTTLIIGNGFDLALKLKTSYRDFANSDCWPIDRTPINVRREKCLRNEVHLFTQDHKDPKTGEVLWIDLEGIIKDYALKRKEEEDSPLGEISEDVIKKDWEFLDTLKAHFIIYLSSKVKELIEPEMKGVSQYLIDIVKAIYEKDCTSSIYSFNYTDTAAILSSYFNWINPKVTHVHGRAFTKNPDIVLGVNDRKAVPKAQRYFLKSHQIGFKSNNLFEDLKASDTVIFFGLSFGGNDMDYFHKYFKSLMSTYNPNLPKKTICIFTKDSKSVYAIKSFFEDADVSIRDLYLYTDLRFYTTDSFGDQDCGDAELKSFVELMMSKKSYGFTDIL